MANRAPAIPLAADASAASPHSQPRGWPLFRLGLRPFYLGAAAFALLAVPYWVAGLMGVITLQSSLPPTLWHAHEMLFGFAVAVIVGFLLTAARSWTGLATPRGAHLAALFALWSTARLSAVWAPYPVYALLDVLLLPWISAVLIRVLLRAGNRRNLWLAAIVLLLALANVAFHAAMLGWLDMAPLNALHAGLALIVMIECVIAGRVIPAFTMSALPGRSLKAPPWLERSTLAVTALALTAWVLMPLQGLTATGLAAAALLHGLRLWHWQPWRTRSRPILWVLHAAYGWLPIGLGLLAWAQTGGPSGGAAASAAIHALAVGATGGLVIGMITRTARGHTGRPLSASATEVAAYLLVAGAATARVLVPLLAPERTAHGLAAAAVAWSAAFALYLWTFTPWLIGSRPDGKDG